MTKSSIVVACLIALSAGMARAQPATETTTTRSSSEQTNQAGPPEGTLSTTHEVHASDANGNRLDHSSTSYRSGTGSASQSETTTRSVTPPPAPPATTSSSSSSSTTTTTAPN